MLAIGDGHGAELVKTRERMLHVRDTIARGREALPVGLIPGPPASGRGPCPSDTPAVCGVYRPVRGHWAVRTSVVALHLGPQAAGRPPGP
jgi:hypothetical protein